MGFFDRFKGKKAPGPAPMGKVPLDQQISTLADLGIKAKHADIEGRVDSEWGTETAESDPYNLLLFVLGSEDEEGGTLSDDIYVFDTECVEEEDIYQRIFTRLSVLSKGAFSQITGHTDHERERSSVSFDLGGKRYDWDLEYESDWFDVGSIGRLNRLLEKNGSAEFFFTASPDQNLFVIFTDQKTADALNDLVSEPFFMAGG